MTEVEQWITAVTLAAVLQVSVKTIYRMTEDGRIPSMPVGRQHRYNIEAVKEALAPKPEPVATWAQSARSLSRKRVA
ncbi:helix-turn-helix domain-containing protein [Microbacterium jejuense]|uniref:helix-turn-helix domain-containing protein n=1 Tax=Microbacterium jejuense TaxID=1263637 RepID=UPI0031ED348F